MTHIEMKPVDSAQIMAIGHDPESSTLRIQFKKWDGSPGSTYEYANAPTDKHAAFMAADSKGKFFGEHIKPKADVHPYKKVALP